MDYSPAHSTPHFHSIQALKTKSNSCTEKQTLRGRSIPVKMNPNPVQIDIMFHHVTGIKKVDLFR